MKSFTVSRTHLSPYQHVDFMQLERTLLEELPGIKYRAFSEVTPVEHLVLITNTHTQLSAIDQEILKSTKLIIHPNSGYDHFASEHELWSSIPVIIGHEIRAQAVAEYTLSSLFEGRAALPQHLSWNKERSWDRTLLKDTAVTVFGYGHIGKIVADTLATLGLRVSVIDPFIQSCPHRHFKRWQDSKIKEAQIILVCASLNKTSRQMFNEDFFSQLNKEIIFVNGARGGLVNEPALREFLLTHPDSMAFLDVFQEEPFKEDWHHFPQVWKTSHIAGVYKGLDQNILHFEKKVLSDFLSLSEDSFREKYTRQLLQNKWIQGELI